MLFEAHFHERICSGEIDCTFRRWKKLRVIEGNIYRIVGGRIQVDRITILKTPEAITPRDARRSGYTSKGELITDLRGDVKDTLYRIEFHLVAEPDPRAVLSESAELSDEDRSTIDARLDRYDRASTNGPWTRTTLRLIAKHPGRRAKDLAAMLEREMLPFKVDVRKLKNLGLTLSLEVGYKLSPRGEAYLSRL